MRIVDRATCRAALVAGCWVASMLIGPAAMAHPILAESATVHFEDGALVLEMTVEQHDLEHSHLGALSDETAVEHSNEIVDRVAIWTGLGDRLRWNSVKATVDEAGSIERVKYRYPIAVMPSYLTLRLEPTVREAVPIGQLTIAVTSAKIIDPQVITLTARGNAQSVDLCIGPSSSAPGLEAIWRALPNEALGDPLASVKTQVAVGEKTASVAVSIPAPTLRSWLWIPLGDQDYLSQSERTKLSDSIRQWLPHRLTLLVNGQPQTMRISQIHFVSPMNATNNDDPILVWSARVVIALHAEAAESISSLDLTWDVFNSAVLTAQAAILTGDESAIGELTTYNPHLVWRRTGDSIQWRIGQREGVFETVKP